MKIYGLIGEGTSGNVITNCLQLKKYANCTFVGQSTYGNINEYSDDGLIILPNSKIYIVFSTKYVENVKNYKDDSLYPNIQIKYTFKDFVEGKDRDMEFILNKLKQ